MAEPAVPTETHHTKESLTEDATAHLADTLATVDKDDGHLFDFEPYLVSGKLHLNLEAVALEAYLVEGDGGKHTAAVALEAGGGVVDLEAGDHAHVLGREIAHQHAPDGPVDDIDTAHIARTDSYIVALVMTGRVEAWQVGRVVTEIGIHLEDVVVIVLERPLETGDIGGAESEFAAALDEKQAVAKLVGHKALDYLGSTIRAAVVDDQDVKTLVQGENRTNDFLHIFLLVVCRNNYNTIAGIHTSPFFLQR